jgi:alkylated DNA repair dioxygenase AlkB
MESTVIAPSVRYLPHVVADPDVAFSRLVAEVAWRDSMRARRTASFGRPYNYSGQSYPAAPMHEVVRSIADVASELAGHPFDNCLCNLYETGNNTMGFHTDSYAELEPDSSIAIVSLGAPRTLLFRAIDRRTTHVAYTLEHGSMLMIDRATQERWQHAVPRSRGVGPRISLTFRRFLG